MPDAPADLPDRNLQLALRPLPDRAGIGFVRSQSGAVFKVWLVEVGEDADALMRTARLRFSPVPVVAGGGAFRLPRTLGAPSAASLHAIRSAIELGNRIPGQSMVSYLGGDFVAAEPPGPQATLRGGRNIVFEGLTAQQVELAEQGALFVDGRLGRDASVVLRGGGAAGIGGDLAGLLRTDGYAYLFVGGDLTGTLDIRSYTTAVVLGDLRGTIRVRSYTDLYLRGRIFGTLDIAGSGWCTFYFQSFLGRADLERLQGSGEITLHLMQSDLDAGHHTGVGKWREVIVGDPLWQQLAR